jgi:hypothetical protein
MPLDGRARNKLTKPLKWLPEQPIPSPKQEGLYSGSWLLESKDLRELSSQEKSRVYKLKYDGQNPDQILIWRSFTPCIVYQH